MMGLRLSGGIDYSENSEKILHNINSLLENSLLEVVSGKLRATPKGRPLLNYVLRELLV